MPRRSVESRLPRPITGTNQSVNTYWDRIKVEFDERKLVDPFKSVYMQRGSKAMANHWGLIQTACNKWHGIVEEIAARPESGASVEDQVHHVMLSLFLSSCARPRRLMFVPRHSCCACLQCSMMTMATKSSCTYTSSSGSTSARSGQISAHPRQGQGDV